MPRAISPASLSTLRVSSHMIPAHGLTPNSSALNKPLLIYHSVFPASQGSVSASAIESHLKATGVVTPQWRYTSKQLFDGVHHNPFQQYFQEKRLSEKEDTSSQKCSRKIFLLSIVGSWRNVTDSQYCSVLNLSLSQHVAWSTLHKQWARKIVLWRGG